MRAVITVVGKDRTGIIASVSGYLAEKNINILDISQTIMQGLFTMIMLVDTSSSAQNASLLASELEELAEKIGVKINVQHEELFSSMHRV